MKSRKYWGMKALLGMLSLILVMAAGLFLESFSMISLAAGKGKVTGSSVNVRKEANATSEVVTGAVQNDVVTVNGQVTGSDGNVWYKVEINGAEGYIRSDLMSVTEDGATDLPAQITANVTKVVPVGAKVTNGQMIRVRSDASTESSIVTTVQNGTELTVIGQATGSDGKVWYQVKFTTDGSEKTGFIREDYVNLSGNVVPETEAQPETPDEPEVQDPVPEAPAVEETKRWETSLQDETWYLIDNENAKRYEINDMLSAATTNAELYYDSQDTVKSQKWAIIILVILLMAAIGGAVYMYYRFKDATDAAYISAVEKETIIRREVQPGQRPTSKPGQRPTGQPGQRPVGQPGQRPAGQPGQRPAGQPGQRPAGQPGQRPTGQPGQRPAGQPGQRPAGQPGQRPAGQPGQRPAGQPGQIPTGQPGQRPAEQPVQKTAAQSVSQPYHQPVPPQKPIVDRADSQSVESLNVDKKATGNAEEGWKAKNFLTDEDEFEFDFLNWDGADEE